MEISTDGQRVSVVCGSSRFTLPTLPVDEYPALPQMPTATGTVPGDVFASAVSQAAVAAGRDDTLPVLTGVRVEIEGDRITLAATDRYRFAVRELLWKPEQSDISAVALVPAKTLQDIAKSLGSGDNVSIALSSGGAGEGLIGFEGAGRRPPPGCWRASSPSSAACSRRSSTPSRRSRPSPSWRRSSASRWSPSATPRSG